MNKIIITTALLVLLICAAATVQSQIVFGQKPSGNPQLVYTHWKLDFGDGLETTVSQSYIPVSAFVPIQDNLEAQIYMATSSSSAEYSGFDNSVSGLSDARIQISRSFSEDHILISGGINVPIGKKKLDFMENWSVIELLSQDFLEFPVRSLGEGFGFNLLVGGATMLGDARVGGGITYQFKGEYEPYAETGDYDPGDIIAINAGGDITKGKMTWVTNVVFTTYTADKQDGLKTFKQSQQIAVSVSGAHIDTPHDISGYLSYVIRGDNSFYSDSEALLSQYKLYGNEFSAGANAIFNLANRWAVGPSAGIRLIAENELTLGSTDIFNFGGSVSKQIGENLSADGGFKYFTGNVNDNLIDLSGYQFHLGLLANF
ncbi:MAG: hypothetical protein AB1483_04375 [Candidatus Zixiibacteriota bacterium]